MFAFVLCLELARPVTCCSHIPHCFFGVVVVLSLLMLLFSVVMSCWLFVSLWLCDCCVFVFRVVCVMSFLLLCVFPFVSTFRVSIGCSVVCS